MDFPKTILVLGFINCSIAYILAEKAQLDVFVTLEELEQQCQKKGLVYNDTLKEAYTKLDIHYKQIMEKSIAEINENSSAKLIQVVNKNCMVADSKLFIAELLKATLLCFDKNDFPTVDKRERILNASLLTFCSTRILHGVFFTIHKVCLEKAEQGLIECTEDSQGILNSFLVDLIYPLPMKFTKQQCEFGLGELDCYNNVVKYNCKSAVSSLFDTITNKAKANIVACAV